MRKIIVFVLLSIISIGITNAESVLLSGKKFKKRMEYIQNEWNKKNFQVAYSTLNNKDTVLSNYNFPGNNDELKDWEKLVLEIKTSQKLRSAQFRFLKYRSFDGNWEYLFNYFFKPSFNVDYNSEGDIGRLDNMNYGNHGFTKKECFEILGENKTNEILRGFRIEIVENNLSDFDDCPTCKNCEVLRNKVLTTYSKYNQIKSNFHNIDSLANNMQLSDFNNYKADTTLNKLIKCTSKTSRDSINNNRVNGGTYNENNDLRHYFGNETANSLYDELKELKKKVNIIYRNQVGNLLKKVDFDSLDNSKLRLIMYRLNQLSLISEKNEIERFFDLDSFAAYEVFTKRNLLFLLDRKGENLKNTQSPDLTISYVYGNLLPFNQFIPKTLTDILNLDVYSYFGIPSINTPLKKQVFEESNEYKSDLRQLKSMKAILESSSIYFENDYTKKADYYQDLLARFLITSNYNLQTGGFVFRFNCTNDVTPFDVTSVLPSKTFRCIDQKDLFIQINSEKFPIRIKDLNDDKMSFSKELGQEMFVPVEKSMALDIESNPEKIRVLFITLGEIKSKPWIYKQPMSSDQTHYGLISTDKIRMIVMNKETGKKYFDKIY